MKKGLLQNIILEVLEESDYRILTQDVNPKNLLIIKLDYDNLIVSVTAQQTFDVKGPNDSTIKELKEFINDNIKPKVRKEALKIFEKGGEEWNKWRKTHGQLFIDFSGLEVTNKNLSGINFQNVDLSDGKFFTVNFENANLRSCILNRAKLINCDLKRANLVLVKGQLSEFTGSDLSYSKLRSAELNAADLKNTIFLDVDFEEVKLNYANLSKADLKGVSLSGCIINEETVFKGTDGIEFGINGVYSPYTDSAALFSSSPPGNSMKGPNVSAVTESLKRARKFFGFSFLLSLTALLIYYLDQDSTKLPFFTDFEINNQQYLNIAMIFSVGLLILSKSFIDDAFEGMKYLEDRSSAMTVGSFPWVMTKYAGNKLDQVFISRLSRFVLCVHPLFYLILHDWSNVNMFFIVLLLLLITISGWILIFSKKFQLPILFDTKQEEQKNSDNVLSKLEELNKLLRDNLNRMNSMIR